MALSPAEILNFLEKNEFLSPAQIGELRPRLGSFPDSHSLAKELIRRDWVTPFQVNQILQGRQDQLVLGNYRVRERIGEGAMGQVFKAWHLRTLRVVAVKTLLKEMVKSTKAMERFRREIETASQLEHPNIAHVLDADEAEGKPYLVMDFIDGFNLSQRVKQRGPLAVGEAVEYCRQAALGLQHAYEHGIVHRDIKPANLIVTMNHSNGPLVKILDFGLARFDSESDDPDRLTQVGRLLGTIDYVSPEQAQDARTADIRADIYSLGCTLHWLLTGQPPFPGENMVEKLSPRVTGEAPWIREQRPEVPPRLEEVLRKMMARRPDDRYQTPIEVAQALEQFAHVPAITPPPIAMAVPVGAMDVPVAAPIVPMAQPIVAGGDYAQSDTMDMANTPLAEPTAPSTQPEFLGMSATGRDTTTGKAAPPPRPKEPGAASRKLPLILGGAAMALVVIPCIACLLMYLFTPPKKKGSIEITQIKYANPNNVLKPGYNFILVYIKRVDFEGPVTVTIKEDDLPAGVSVQKKTIPAKNKETDLRVTVSHGTPAQSKQVHLVAECEAENIVTEFSFKLNVIDDINKLKKK